MCCSYPDWYGAKVTEIRSEDGSFRLRYDDGYYNGFWFAANTEYIRREGNELGSAQRAEGGIRGSGGSRLEEGMKVEARYRGASRYYPGKISRDNRDGTYDINYDDGDREMGVREELIKALNQTEGLGLAYPVNQEHLNRLMAITGADREHDCVSLHEPVSSCPLADSLSVMSSTASSAPRIDRES